MSSIKTLSSFSFPADVSKKNKNGDESSGQEEDVVADGKNKKFVDNILYLNLWYNGQQYQTQI